MTEINFCIDNFVSKASSSTLASSLKKIKQTNHFTPWPNTILGSIILTQLLQSGICSPQWIYNYLLYLAKAIFFIFFWQNKVCGRSHLYSVSSLSLHKMFISSNLLLLLINSGIADNQSWPSISYFFIALFIIFCVVLIRNSTKQKNQQERTMETKETQKTQKQQRKLTNYTN